MKRDLDYLRLLARAFPVRMRRQLEIINLRAICGLPKGTEYFFSDLHGESEAFIFLDAFRFRGEFVQRFPMFFLIILEKRNS